MSLKNIGNLNDVTKAISTLKGFDTFNEGAEYLNKFTKYSDQTKFDMLSSAFQNIEKDAIKTALGITDVADAASDLTDVASRANSKVDGFGSAIKGVWSVIKANPLASGAIGAAVAIPAIVSGFKIYKEHLNKEASEATEVWNTSLSGIQDQIKQYEELKTQLDSGTLSGSEEITVKQQILDLQHQITSTYGEQAAGIDLVNGKLETQLATIKKMAQEKTSEEADTNLRDNKKAYSNAKKEMLKEREYDLGSYSKNIVSNTGDEQTDEKAARYNYAKEKIIDIADSFKDQGIVLEDNQNGYSVDIKFKGDATQAESVINDFKSKLLEVEKEYKNKYGVNGLDENEEVPIIGRFLQNSHNVLSENQKVLDKHKENYESFLEQTMFKNEKGNILTDYEDAINALNTAVLSDNAEEIHKATQAYTDATKAKNDFLSQEGNQQFERLFSSMDESLDKSSLKYFDFKEAISGKLIGQNNQFKSQSKDLRDYSNQLKEAKLDVVDIQQALENTSDTTEITTAIRGIADAWGITSSSSIDEIQAFCDVLAQLNLVTETTSQSTTESADTVNASLQNQVTASQKAYTDISNAITESMSNTGLTSDSIKLIKEQVSSITEEFDELSNYDLNSLFTNSAKGVKLNNDRFEDLLQLQHQLKVADFAEQIGKQSDAVKTLTDDLGGLTEGTDEYNQKNTELINAQNQLSEMEQARSQYHAIYQQQQALFSEYAEWQRAQQTENAGDPYLNLLSGLEQAKEAYDQGLVGTDDFKAFAKIISPSGATDPINFAENYGTAAKYLTKDSSGITTFLKDLSTKTDAAGNAMASFNEQTGEWKMNIHSLGEVASALGTGETVVEAVLGRAEDYGATSYVISDMEDGILKTSEAIQKKTEAEVRLRQMQEANEKNPGTYNETAMQGAADEVEKYTQQINGLTESMQYMQEHPTENIVSNTAKQEIDELNKQRQQLLEEANGDTSSAAYKTAEELKNAIQSKADSANLELDAELNVTGVKQSAQEALKELQGQEGSVISPEIDFNYDKSTMSLNQLDSKIQELNAEKVRIQAEADTPEAQAALEQLDAETQALQSQKIQVKIQTAIEEGNSIDELLAMSDADIITTVGCDASEVDAVRQKLLEMQGESITASVKIDQAQFTSLINAITGQPVEVPVEADTSNVASQVEQSTSGTSVKVDVEPKPIDPNAVASLQSSQTVNVTGNVTTLTAGVGLTPVAVTGNVVQLTGTPSTPIDVVGNITEVTGGEGKTIEVIGHIATVTGGNGKMINVIGNITSVTGGDSTSGTINYEKGDVEKADGTVSTGIINYKKGDVEKADGTVSTGTINYDLGTVADAGSPVATGTINYKLGSVAKPGGATVTGTMASGTMLSSAQANGTAYNVLNMHPLTSANALGNVTVPRDQVSLTNEVGMNMPLYLLI